MDNTDWDDSYDDTFNAPKHCSITDIQKDKDINIDIDAFIVGDPIKIEKEIKSIQTQPKQPLIKKPFKKQVKILTQDKKINPVTKMLKCEYCNRATSSNRQTQYGDQILCNRCEKFDY
jgi:hypothetical protein